MREWTRNGNRGFIGEYTRKYYKDPHSLLSRQDLSLLTDFRRDLRVRVRGLGFRDASFRSLSK